MELKFNFRDANKERPDKSMYTVCIIKRMLYAGSAI